MSNQIQNPNNKDKYDLIERTGKFGANYMEADGAESKKDFKHKIAICKKEAKETMHRLRMIAKANFDKTEKCRALWKETHELALMSLRARNRAKQSIVKIYIRVIEPEIASL